MYIFHNIPRLFYLRTLRAINPWCTSAYELAPSAAIFVSFVPYIYTWTSTTGREEKEYSAIYAVFPLESTSPEGGTYIYIYKTRERFIGRVIFERERDATLRGAIKLAGNDRVLAVPGERVGEFELTMPEVLGTLTF